MKIYAFESPWVKVSKPMHVSAKTPWSTWTLMFEIFIGIPLYQLQYPLSRSVDSGFCIISRLLCSVNQEIGKRPKNDWKLLFSAEFQKPLWANIFWGTKPKNGNNKHGLKWWNMMSTRLRSLQTVAVCPIQGGTRHFQDVYILILSELKKSRTEK